MTGSQFDKALARIAVSAYDGAQEERKAMMNRVRDIVRKKNEGIPFDEVEAEKDDNDYDDKYKDDNLPRIIREMREEGTLTDDEFEYLIRMLDAGQKARDIEDDYNDVMQITENEPIYTEWLTNVNGVSSTLTARLIHEFGYCETHDRVSQMWSYAGLAPGQSPTRGEKLGYNPDAKTLAWTVADCMIKQGSRSRYRSEFYDPYKDEQLRRIEVSSCKFCGNPTCEVEERSTGLVTTWQHDRDGCDEFHDAQSSGNVPSEAEFNLSYFELDERTPDEASPAWSAGHADNRARRYLMKKFLKHYWAIARDIQGLPTPDEYVLVHGDGDGNAHEKETDTFENPFYAKAVLNGEEVPATG